MPRVLPRLSIDHSKSLGRTLTGHTILVNTEAPSSHTILRNKKPPLLRGGLCVGEQIYNSQVYVCFCRRILDYFFIRQPVRLVFGVELYLADYKRESHYLPEDPSG